MSVIEYINLVTYVQKSIDNILCLLCIFVRAYIDNIMIGAGLLEKHRADL